MDEPVLTATAAIVIDSTTGSVLFSKSPATQLEMASTTKLMTALLAYEYDNALDDQVTVSAAAAGTGGTQADLIIGEVLTMGELLLGLMLPSGNDAAVAVAEHVGQTYLGGVDGADGLSKFVARMNARAGELGLTNTAYINPHGMDAVGHYSSAADLAKLGREVFSHAALKAITGTLSHAGVAVSGGPAKPHNWKNLNRALGQYPGTVCGKTGTTAGAGQCLVTLHERSGRSLITAVLESTDRYLDTTRMLEYVYSEEGTASETAQGRSNTEHADYTGTWAASSYFITSYPENGYGKFSSTAGATASYRFFGTSVQVVTITSSARGMMDVSMDGGPAETIDLYSVVSSPGVVVYEKSSLADGFHTLLITVRGEKHPSSSATTVALENFVVNRVSTGGSMSSLANAIAAFGTLIQVGDGSSPETFHTIAGVGDIDGPGVSVDEFETTNHSTGTPHKTWVPTLIDDGSIAFPMFYQPTHPTHSLTSTYGLEYLFQNRVTRNFRIVTPDPSTTKRQFAGFVKDMGESYPVAGVMVRDVTIRIASAPEVV